MKGNCIMKKKLFISCPMKDRTKENINRSMERMHKLAEIIFDQELEVIPTWIDEEPPADCVNPGVWYLGKSLELLSQADYFIAMVDILNERDIEWRKYCNQFYSDTLEGMKQTKRRS